MTVTWSMTKRDERDARARRAFVREERLRATAGLRQILPLSAWRGRSGRRYVVGIHALTEPHVEAITDAVLIAIRRSEDGAAQVVALGAADARPRAVSQRHWMARARASGATELHVHCLAETDDERRAIIEDLSADDAA